MASDSFVFCFQESQTNFGYVYVYPCPAKYNLSQLICVLSKYFQKYKSLLTQSNTLNVVFSSQIDSAQKETLDLIIASHTPKPNTFINILTNQVKIKNKMFVAICNFIFPGTDVMIAEKIQMYAQVTGKTNDTYDVKIVDVLTNKTIFEKGEYKSTEPELIDIMDISKTIRNKQTVCEIQCRSLNNADVTVFCAQLVAFYE